MSKLDKQTRDIRGEVNLEDEAKPADEEEETKQDVSKILKLPPISSASKPVAIEPDKES